MTGNAANGREKGSIGNPITERDLPFEVPKDGYYWIEIGGVARHLPFSPAGSTIDVEVRRER